MGHLYWESFQTGNRLQIGAGMCAVPTRDAVPTGEVKSFTFIVRLRALPRFAKTMSQGYSSAAQQILACGDPLWRLTVIRLAWCISVVLYWVVPAQCWIYSANIAFYRCRNICILATDRPVLGLYAQFNCGMCTVLAQCGLYR